MSCKECNFRYDCPDVFTPIAVYCNNYDKDQEDKEKTYNLQTIPLESIPIGGLFIIEDNPDRERIHLCQVKEPAASDDFIAVNDMTVQGKNRITDIYKGHHVAYTGVILPVQNKVSS